MSVRSKVSPNDLVTQHVLQNFPTPSSTKQSVIPSWVELLGAAPPKTFAPNVEIFGEAEPVDYLYKVVEGAVRTCKFLDDGRRQIACFYLSGEFFGFEAGDKHTLSAEAITKVKILSIKRSVLAVLADSDIKIAHRLRELTDCELKRAQTHTTLLIMNAEERVAQFLLEMASHKQKTTVIDLPMTRQDIGDYLGLTIETVSRVLSNFVAAKIITRTTTRHVVLRNPLKLKLVLQGCAGET